MQCQEEEKILEIKMDNFKMPDRQIYPQSNKKPLKVRRLNKNLVFFKQLSEEEMNILIALREISRKAYYLGIGQKHESFIQKV